MVGIETCKYASINDSFKAHAMYYQPGQMHVLTNFRLSAFESCSVGSVVMLWSDAHGFITDLWLF
jgi:hypothetical protein